MDCKKVIEEIDKARTHALLAQEHIRKGDSFNAEDALQSAVVRLLVAYAENGGSVRLLLATLLDRHRGAHVSTENQIVKEALTALAQRRRDIADALRVEINAFRAEVAALKGAQDELIAIVGTHANVHTWEQALECVRLVFAQDAAHRFVQHENAQPRRAGSLSDAFAQFDALENRLTRLEIEHETEAEHVDQRLDALEHPRRGE